MHQRHVVALQFLRKRRHANIELTIIGIEQQIDLEAERFELGLHGLRVADRLLQPRHVLIIVDANDERAARLGRGLAGERRQHHHAKQER